MLKTIKDEWETFSEVVYGGKNISQIQYDETKRAFYAGAYVVLTHAIQIGKLNITKRQEMDHFKSLKLELEEYFQDQIRKSTEIN